MARTVPSFEEFEKRAGALFASIPEEFRRGVDALVVHREARPHPVLEGSFTLGECTDSPLQLADAPLRSAIHLYYGSFRELAARDPDFDVEEELEETILHELRHHVEDRAGAPDLLVEDAVEEANERRRAGLSFDPTFYLAGEEVEPAVHRVGSDLFLDLPMRRRELRRLGSVLRVRLGGEEIEVEAPGDPERPVTFLEVPGGWEDEEGGAGDLFVCLRLLD